ncbi:MAG: hypothetical protein L6265_01650 [Thermoplasmatales archaeon]|nr:hypothetical protein [Thermoplasmatales archaeon]
MQQKIAIITIVLLLVMINIPSSALHSKLFDDNPIKILQKSDILSAWKEDVRLTNDSADSIRADVSVDTENNPHVVWGDMRTGKMEVFYKRYDGKNWTEYTRLDYNDEGGSGFPSVAVSNYNIHVGFADNRRPDYKSEIYYTMYNESDWGIPERVTYDSGYSISWSPQIGPRIVTDSKGYVYIFWTDTSDIYPDGHDIAYVYYNGSNWSTIQRATDDHRDEYDHFNSVVAVDSNDNLHLAYVTNRPSGIGGYSIYEIHYRKFDGNNWSEEVNVSNSIYGAKNYPSVAVDSQNNVHVVWLDTRDDPEAIKGEIYYTKLDTNGDILVNNSKLTEHYESSWAPSIAIDKQNNVHIVWLIDHNASHNELRYMKLDNDGNIIINDTYLTESCAKDADYFSIPRIAIDSMNRLHVVFMDDGDGNYEIYYKGTYAQDLSISSEDIVFSNPYPEPNETIWINATVHNNGEILTNATVKFYDGLVADENLIDTCNVSVPLNDAQNASVLWDATAGNHTIWVVVNCTDVIAEANITNNTAGKNLLVKSQHPPDVMIDSPENFDVYLDTDSIYFDAGNSSDLDNDTLSFYWVSNISGYIENTSQFHASLPIGYHLITLWVDDNSGHNVSATVNVTVKENLPPEIKDYNPKTNVTIMEIQNQTFTITAEDPNNRTLTYMWYLNDTPLAGENNSSYTFIPENNYSGDYLIKVIVSDGYFSKNYTWTVTVVNVEQLQNMIEDLEDQLNQTMVNNTELQNQLEDIRTSLNSIWNQLNQSLTNNTELENQILMLNQNITSMQNQINQLIQEKEELKDERNQAVKDKEDLEQFVLLTEIISLVIGIFIGFFVLYVFRKKLLK